jgi:hypothetical protein
MPNEKIVSIGEEMKKLEGDSPWAELSSLKEQLREVEARAEPNAWPPEERVMAAELQKKIATLEASLHQKKAA